jgi:hypothetical protein
VDLKDQMVAAAVGVFASSDENDWCITIGSSPDKPTKCLTLYDTGGPQPDRTMDRSQKAIMSPQIQVRARAATYIAGYQKLQDLVDLTNQWGKFARGSSWFEGVFQSSDIMFLERDGKDRYVFTVNFQVKRKESV